MFFTRKLIDRWGGGTSRILRLCNEHELPTPLFAEETDGFVVKFYFKESIGTEIQPIIHTPIPLKDREKEILQILAKHKTLSVSMIADLLHNPPANRTIGDDLSHLKDLELIDSEGIGRGARWFLINPSKA